MVKAKFKDSVRSKADVAMWNEVYCKFLCHNICCLIMAQCELGIEAEFWQDASAAAQRGSDLSAPVSWVNRLSSCVQNLYPLGSQSDTLSMEGATMRRRELLIVFLSITWLIAGSACWLLYPSKPKSKINETNYGAIRDGMTEAEVETILGGPAGDYCTGEVESSFKVNYGGCGPPLPSSEHMAGWIGDDGLVLLAFDEKGMVKSGFFSPMKLTSLPLRERVRRWLGLAGNGE